MSGAGLHKHRAAAVTWRLCVEYAVDAGRIFHPFFRELTWAMEEIAFNATVCYIAVPCSVLNALALRNFM